MISTGLRALHPGVRSWAALPESNLLLDLRPLTCSAPSGVVLRRLLSSGNIPSSRTHGGPGWEDGLPRIQRRLESKTHHTGPRGRIAHAQFPWPQPMQRADRLLSAHAQRRAPGPGGGGGTWTLSRAGSLPAFHSQRVSPNQGIRSSGLFFLPSTARSSHPRASCQAPAVCLTLLKALAAMGEPDRQRRSLSHKTENRRNKHGIIH